MDSAIKNNNGEALRRKIAKRDKRRQKTVYFVLLAPFFVLFFLFTVLPVLSSVVLSFFDFKVKYVLAYWKPHLLVKKLR